MANVAQQVALSQPLKRPAIFQAKRMSKHVTKEALELSSQAININTRVWPMFEEALEFQPYIEAFEREVKGSQANVAAFFETILPLLSIPLPRVWKLVEGDRGEPVRVTESHGHHTMAGGDCDLASIRESVSHFEKSTRHDICRPLAAWLDSLQLARDRFPELQSLYHEAVKSARRLLAETENGHKGRKLGDMLRGCTTHPAVRDEERAGSRGVAEQASRVEQQNRSDEHEIAVKDRRRKFEAALDSFNEQERLMFDHLSGLCRDAAWLKSYMASELVFLKELMQEAAFFMGPSMQPLPIFDAYQLGEKQEREVTDNVDLIACGRPSYLDEAEDDWSSGEPAAHINRAPRAAKHPLEYHTQPRLPPTPTSSPTESLAYTSAAQPQTDVVWQEAPR